MANIVLPQVDILSEINDDTNILIEQNGIIQRVNKNTFLDDGLTTEGVAAEASAVGRAIESVKNDINNSYDTLKDFSDFLNNNPDIMENLQDIDEKVSKTDFNGHINNNDIHITSIERAAWNAIEEKSQKYTDDAVSSKSCVQIITWEADD